MKRIVERNIPESAQGFYVIEDGTIDRKYCFRSSNSAERDIDYRKFMDKAFDFGDHQYDIACIMREPQLSWRGL